MQFLKILIQKLIKSSKCIFNKTYFIFLGINFVSRVFKLIKYEKTTI